MVDNKRMRRQRWAIYKRENRRCFWCDTPLRFENSTRDHIVTRSNGGGNTMDNYVLSCSPCNNERGDIDAEIFLMKKMGFGMESSK